MIKLIKVKGLFTICRRYLDDPYIELQNKWIKENNIDVFINDMETMYFDNESDAFAFMITWNNISDDDALSYKLDFDND